MSYKSYLMNWRVKKIFESKVISKRSLALCKNGVETVSDPIETKLFREDLEKVERLEEVESMSKVESLEEVESMSKVEIVVFFEAASSKQHKILEPENFEESAVTNSEECAVASFEEYAVASFEEYAVASFEESAVTNSEESAVTNLDSVNEVTQKTNEETHKKFSELLTHFKVLCTKKENIVTQNKNNVLKKEEPKNVIFPSYGNISTRTFDFAYLRHKWEIISNK